MNQSLTNIRAKMAQAQAKSMLSAPSITLIGVSKGQTAQRLEDFIKEGLIDFGENRVQEAQSKWENIREIHPGIRLHLIGPLQRNKARDAVALFDMIHTLDRPTLAETLAEEMARAGKSIPCLIQVNTGEEEQKAGTAPAGADAFITQCREQWKLNIAGLMCVPPVNRPAGPHFALLREIALRNGLSELSMGMSGDFETAIRFGATMVRIGTALFGERR